LQIVLIHYLFLGCRAKLKSIHIILNIF